MIRRFSHNSKTPDDARHAQGGGAAEFSVEFYLRKLNEALGDGVDALKDPEIEAQVKAYFEENPNYSRDAVHVAGIACRFKKEKVQAACRQGNGIKV